MSTSENRQSFNLAKVSRYTPSSYIYINQVLLLLYKYLMKYYVGSVSFF